MATRTIRIWVTARDKNGILKYRKDGSAVGRRRAVSVKERCGAWAITPYLRDNGIESGWTVTHIPTGRKVTSFEVSLADARRVLKHFAALPNQARWRRLKHQRHMTKKMREAGNELVKRLQI